MTSRLLAHNGTGAVIGEKLIYHLSLDLTFTRICADGKKRSIFLKELSSPPTDTGAIKSRQAVLRDFISSPELLERMRGLANDLGAIREKWEEHRRARSRSLHGGSLSVHGVSPQETSSMPLAQCKAAAMSLKNALLLIRDLGALLDEYSIESETLLSWRDNAKEMASSPSFTSLVSVCGELEYRPARDPLDLRVTLNAQGQIGSAELIDHKYIRITDPDLSPRRSFFKKQPDQESCPCERLYPTSNEVYEKLYTAPYFDAANVLDHILKQIFETYSTLASDLAFYGAAVLYCEYLSKQGVSYVFPEFHGDGGFEVKNLYDVQFIVTKNAPSNIVPHTISCGPDSKRGIVIFGENGSGKTSFLRSFATMQLLAQSGLPIPSEKADLRIFSGILSQFAESEHEFVSCGEAGRFEGEVSELASLLDSVPPGSLVILNETFQTTSYDEGAVGLCDILRYLSREGIVWFIASHMKQIKAILGEEAAYITVSPKHELVCEQ